MNTANKLTLLRILLIPLFILALLLPNVWQGFAPYAHWVAAMIFLAAAITDILDGKYARKHNVVTDFGKLMDPIADKLLTASCMIMLIGRGLMSFCDELMPLFTIIVLAREFLVSGIRLVAASKGRVIAAGKLGKMKTLLQSISLPVILIAGPVFKAIGVPIDFILLAAAVVMTIWSGLDYALRNKEVFKAE
jgi:CDP-diacylglycerol--glycerol-3-phosphate 3-phosphatidyltransferase